MYSALIAVQAGVDRRDMAVVTAFRKYVPNRQSRNTTHEKYKLTYAVSSETSEAHSASPLPEPSCKFLHHLPTTMSNGRFYRNNLLSSSISSVGLSDSEKKSFLSSPSNYLNKLPDDEAAHVRSVLIPAYKQGFRIIFIIGGALSAFAFFLAVVLMPQVTLKRDDDEKLKQEAKERLENEKGKSDEEENK